MRQHFLGCYFKSQGLILVFLFLIFISTGCKSTERILTDHQGLWVGWFWLKDASGKEERQDSKGVYHFEKNGKASLQSLQSVWGTKFEWAIEGKHFFWIVEGESRRFEIVSQTSQRVVLRLIPEEWDIKNDDELFPDFKPLSKLELKRVFE